MYPEGTARSGLVRSAAEGGAPAACGRPGPRPGASGRAWATGSRFDAGNMAASSGYSTRSSVRPVTSCRATTTSKTSRSISQ